MISKLTSSSVHIVTNSFSPPYIGNNGQSAGNMRFNTMTQQMEVFDGNAWQVISQNITVDLSWTAEEAIRWAHEKMSEERNLKERMEKHPGLKDAYEKFQIMDILTKEEAKHESQWA